MIISLLIRPIIDHSCHHYCSRSVDTLARNRGLYLLTIILLVEPTFIIGRNTFIREASSKMYSQPIFAIGQLAAEMPYSILCAVVYFLLYYFPTGFQFASSRAGYAFFMILVAEIYSVTLWVQ